MRINKILFLLSLLFLVLIPTAKAGATQVYVGFQISNAKAQGCGTDLYLGCPGNATGIDNHWCLPGGTAGFGSESAIATNNTGSGTCYAQWHSYDPDPSWLSDACPDFLVNPVSASSKYSYINYPACPGSIVWSSLVDLTTSSNYNVYLYAPGSCPGYVTYTSGWRICWVADRVNENCCNACAHYGLSAYYNHWWVSGSSCLTSNECRSAIYDSEDDSNCSAEAALMGSPCSSCTIGASYSYFDPGSKSCWTTYNPNSNAAVAYNSCSATLSGGPNDFARVCDCNYPQAVSSFLIPFTF